MILTALLLIILIILVTIVLVAVATGGAVFIVIFGDVIVCAFIIGWLIKKLNSRKK